MRSLFPAPSPPNPPLGFDFTFAFQPIVDVAARRVFAYEALIRGLDGAGAASVLARVTDANHAAFDEAVRVRAIAVAAPLLRDGDALLSINVLPNAVVRPSRGLAATLHAATHHRFPLDRLMFEFTENERVEDVRVLRRVAAEYTALGFTTAIDDFGAGFSCLGLLAEVVPNILKLDRGLVRDIGGDRVRKAILRGVVTTATALGVALVAEGVETDDEFDTLAGLGITLFQGYRFARPAFERLPEIRWEAPAARPLEFA